MTLSLSISLPPPTRSESNAERIASIIKAIEENLILLHHSNLGAHKNWEGHLPLSHIGIISELGTSLTHAEERGRHFSKCIIDCL